MDDGNFTPNSTFGAFPDTVMDLDFMDELLFDGCWLETSDAVNFLQPGSSSSGPVDDPSQYLPCSEGNTGHLNINLNPQQVYQEETKRKFAENQSLVYPKFEGLQETYNQNCQGFNPATSSGQSGSLLFQGNESGGRWWIAPRANTSIKDRLMEAIGYLKEYIKDGNALVQIWVPINRGGKHVLTTDDQPYSIDPNCKSLESYRNVSTTYQFAADEDSNEVVGLPGRVFLGKSPEWTPDVRFFRSEEYPRVSYAKQYDVHGSLALPVFERGSGICLGVVEIITTSQKINYRPDLENVCKALEAVDLRSSENFITSCVKARNELYHTAMPEIADVLRSVCETHKLPLALTWAPCVQERKGECQQSDENCAHRFLTVDSACYVADENLSGFLVACSEHQLLHGQGVVGKAFTLSKQCFTSDITTFSKSNYPLSHFARMFGLRAALAIPLRSITTGEVEFVLEFFLPKECQYTEEQKRMVNSLSVVIQQSCQSLHLTVEKTLEEVILPIGEAGVTSDGSPPSKETSPEQSSWISHMIEAQQKGKGISVSWEHQKEEFKVTTQWDDAQAESYHKQVFPGFGQFQQNSGAKSSVEGGGDSSSPGVRRSIGSRKAGEKRRTKTQKTISMQVLRQYFTGSLKDAAKSIGVCPTTLKRICRQHGITRWPSRKIKKVGHSLKKLQLVIDSVQGAEGAIQIGSFYTSFPELSSPNFSGNGPFSSMKTSDHPEPSNPKPYNGLFSTGAAVSKSPSSSCSQSSGSSTCCSTGTKNTATIYAMSSRDIQMVEDSGGILKRACSDAELLALNLEEPKLLARSQSHKILGEHATLESLPLLPKFHNHKLSDGGTFRVKATFGEEKIRFSLQPNWGFKDLQQEIARRFKIEDFNKIDLKYLDDDDEWVLLTCDADLGECIDIYKPCESHTIKISLHRASHLNLGKLIHNNAPSEDLASFLYDSG